MRNVLRRYLLKVEIKKAVLCFLAVFLTSYKTFSNEDNVKFDSVFNKVATELTNSDPNEAIRVADSLFQHSTNKILQLRALMLKANVYKHLNDYDNALVFSKKAEQLASAEGDVEWEVRILGFIASQYRSIGFFSEGERILVKNERAVEKITNPLKKGLCQILILQERAYYALAKKEYPEGLANLEKSNDLFNELPDFGAKGYHKAVTEEAKGRIYLEQEDYIKAKDAFLEAKKQLDIYKNPEYPLYGYVYAGLGKIAIENEEPRESIEEYYKKALDVAESSFNTNLKHTLYQNLVDFFKKEENWEKYGEFSEKLKLERNKTADFKNEAVNQMFSKVEEERLMNEADYKFYLTISLILGSVSLLVVYVFYRVRQRRYKEKYEKALAIFELHTVGKNTLSGIEENTKGELLEDQPEQQEGVKREDYKIAEETEQRILGKIQEFEEQLLYLESSVSISFLASFCETNIRYVSLILKNNKELDFSSYINTLRIYYIIRKLKEDKEYRNYKISYLADEAGFSSHSKFSSVFKQVIGLSPSEFIDLHTKFEMADS